MRKERERERERGKEKIKHTKNEESVAVVGRQCKEATLFGARETNFKITVKNS